MLVPIVLQNSFVLVFFMWETDFLPLTVLARRAAVPVKISTGNTFPRKYQKLLPILVLNVSDISALQYCTGNFYGSDYGVSHNYCAIRGKMGHRTDSPV